ncbi:MAG: pseudouridine synthase [Bacteroidota bacterium]
MRHRPGKKNFKGKGKGSGRPTSRFKGRKANEARPIPAKEVDIEGMALNKFVAHCGVASRRQSAELIRKGMVKVNEELITEPGHKLQKGDKVSYDGKVIQPESRNIYLLLNKPKDTITTLKDERNRRTVMDLIGPEIKERIFPVGRLDRATTGLLLLTNDGELAQRLSHPSYKIKKIYHVVLDRPLHREDFAKIEAGLELEDGKAMVDGLSYVNGKPKTEVGIEIHIGRNRIVRRIFEHLEYKVKRLDRVFYGGLTKKDIPRGKYRSLSEKELLMLRHFV